MERAPGTLSLAWWDWLRALSEMTSMRDTIADGYQAKRREHGVWVHDVLVLRLLGLGLDSSG